MFEMIAHMWEQYQVFAKDSPVVASIVSVSLIGTLTFALKELPKKIINFIWNQLFTTITIDNSEDGPISMLFAGFMKWFETSNWNRFGRHIKVMGRYEKIDDQYQPVFFFGVGESAQYGWWEGRPVIVTLKRLSSDSNISNKIIYEISIRRMGRSKESLARLVNLFKPKVEAAKNFIYMFREGEWGITSVLRPRDIETVVVADGNKERILAAIDEFEASEQWYVARGISYKLCILLTGRPGTGKTSLIRSIASHYRKNVCTMSINEVTDNSLKRGLATSPDDSIIAIEDFNIQALRKRNEELSASSELAALKDSEGSIAQAKPKKSLSKEVSQLFSLDGGRLSLSGFLQAFDGIDGLHGRIIFLTTNLVEELDAAVVRKGRVDLHVELRSFTDYEIRQYLRICFPEVADKLLKGMDGIFADITGADLQALLIDCKDNPNELIKNIPVIHPPIDLGKAEPQKRYGWAMD